MRSARLFEIAALIFALGPLWCSQAIGAPLYNISLLPSLSSNGSDRYSHAYGINDYGDVVGQSATTGYYTATLWSNGTATDLGKLTGTTDSFAYGINNVGQIVGASAGPSIPGIFGGAWQATQWTNGNISGLPNPNGAVISSALSINDAGQIVGLSTNASQQNQATLWQGGAATNIGIAWGGGGGGYSSPGLSGSINSAGQIAGQSGTGAALWENGTVTNLQWPGGSNSTAYGINDVGQIVGTALNPNGLNYDDGVMWQNGALTFLPDLGFQYSQALDINNDGDIVGFSRSSAPDPFWGSSDIDALLWQGGGFIDLSTLIEGAFGPISGAMAVGINNKGQIVVNAQYNNTPSVFLLSPNISAPEPGGTPVPEPITVALFGAGLAGIAAMRRRQKKSA